MIVFKIIVSSGIHLNKNSQSFGGDTGKLCKCLLLHIVYGNNLHFAPKVRDVLNKNAYQHCVAPVHFILSNN